MIFTLFDRLGDWNPQLWRELKSKFKALNIAIAVILSVGGQFFLYRSHNLLYLSVFIPLILLIGGFYLLSHDLAIEEQRGTLDFIRFSPTSSHKILLGKMLGVPSLIYLGVALAIPLHLGSSLIHRISLITILGQYLFWIVRCYFFYTMACFYSLIASSSPIKKINPSAIAWLGVIAFSVLFFSSFSSGFALPNVNRAFSLHQSILSIEYLQSLYFIWHILNFGGATYFFWKAINRIFYNYNADFNILGKSLPVISFSVLFFFLFGYVYQMITIYFLIR